MQLDVQQPRHWQQTTENKQLREAGYQSCGMHVAWHPQLPLPMPRHHPAACC
jgi:hypothetical protein